MRELRPVEPEQSDRLITLAEAARRYNTTPDRVRVWVGGGCPHYRSGSQIRFHPAELDDWYRHGRRAQGLTRADVVAAIREALSGVTVTLEVK